MSAHIGWISRGVIELAGLGAVIVLIAIGLYFLPTIVAMMRHKENIGTVVVINLFLGWTFLGWVVALAMAFGQTKRPAAAA
jgi:Superinfection immunity protein